MVFLQQLVSGKAPRTLTDPDEINMLMVLRAAGYVAALSLRTTQDGQVRESGRFLAVTPAGRAALGKRTLEA